MFFNNKCNTFFGLNLTLVYTFPMCMTWRFHFPLRNYDFKKTINEVWNVSGVNKTIRELWNVSGAKKTNNEVWNVSCVKKTIDLSTCLSMLMSAVDQLPPNKVTTDLIRVTSSLKTTKLLHMLLQYSCQYYYAVGLLLIGSPTNQSVPIIFLKSRRHADRLGIVSIIIPICSSIRCSTLKLSPQFEYRIANQGCRCLEVGTGEMVGLCCIPRNRVNVLVVEYGCALPLR